MKDVFGSKRRENAQTLVFFTLAIATIILLCGLAIDSGLLYLAKARMGRAVDGAALAAVGNFHMSSVPVTNRDDVANVMRNFAVANFSDLGTVGTIGSSTAPSGGVQVGTSNTYTYNFVDTTAGNFWNGQSQDANGQPKRFIQVTLSTGAGGGITSATINARCPVHTYFIGFAGSYFRDLKVSESAVASRNPRLIMIVADRSGSMLAAGGGAYGLPQSIVQFLDFFDTSSDYIGIVSFGSNARLEMPLTTNFIVAGTNVLFDTYQIDSNENAGVPGVDPEQIQTNADYDSGYAATGVRRMKFGGTTAADDGIRLAMEQMMANSGFNDPDVVKYMVLFTDGAWNNSRTLLAAPGYTNVVTYNTNSFVAPYKIQTNAATSWNKLLASDGGILPVPVFSPMPDVTNAIADYATNQDFTPLTANHTNDQFQSVDTSGYEPISNPTASATQGAPASITTNTWVGNYGGFNYYAHTLDVWLQPGSVDYHYHNGAIANTYVSNLNNPTNNVIVTMAQGDSNVLVVPGYVVDGLFYDNIDLTYPDGPAYGNSTWPRYRVNNYLEPFMWPDDPTSLSTAAKITGYSTVNQGTNSIERGMMFRNYPNLLTGFYVYKPDDPSEVYSASGGYGGGPAGIEPLITDAAAPGAPRPLNGLGPYYPSAPVYWPFDLVGIEGGVPAPKYALTNQSYPYVSYDPDLSHSGYARHLAYTMNMLSAKAAPEWAGEWFYKGTGGTSVVSGSSSVSTLMASKSDWQNGAPSWLINDFDASGESITQTWPVHNSNLAVTVWSPVTFNGSNGTLNTVPLASVTPSGSITGGYVTDGTNYYKNAMAWSGRPTHYFDFSQGKWIALADNHTTAIQALPMGNWKVQEYAWHARAMGVTIYTVGYGTAVGPAQQVILAQVANSTNTTAGNTQTWNGKNVTAYTAGPGTAITYNPDQPIGQQYYATNITDISNDFYSVGQAINGALTQ